MKTLIYDIETTLMRLWSFHLGKQRFQPSQIYEGDGFDIICICYSWLEDPKNKVYSLDWDYKKQDSKQMIKEFDKIIKSADLVIGKNSNKFDNRYINTMRLVHDLPPMPEWVFYTDDLETQIRRFFRLPSYKLDYISSIFGLGGKRKMELKDWIDIKMKTKDGKKAFDKMIDYCKKDVADTKALVKKIWPHVDPKFNCAARSIERCCKLCGSMNIHKNGVRQSGKTVYQNFFCKEHGGYAGRAPISKTGVIGKIG